MFKMDVWLVLIFAGLAWAAILSIGKLVLRAVKVERGVNGTWRKK